MTNKIKIENPNKDSLIRFIDRNGTYLMKCFLQGNTSKTETQVCLVLKSLKKQPTIVKTRLQYSLIKQNVSKN